MFRAIGDVVGQAQIAISLAAVMRFQGDNVQSLTLYKEGLALLRNISGNPRPRAVALAGVGGLAGERGKSEQAAKLLGAAEDIIKTESRFKRYPLSDHARFDSDVASARAQLGEPAFARAWNEGIAMSLEQAIAYALQDVDDTV